MSLTTTLIAATLLMKPIEIFIQEKFEASKSTSEIMRRAAFDLGGGSIRVLVADVNVSTQQVVKKLFNAKIEIPFRKELTDNDQLSAEIEKVALKALSQLKEAASYYQPQHYSGVATEAFRLAKNGQSFLNRLQENCHITIKLIEQEEEGKLGFLAGVVNSHASPSETVVIDIGTGSVQITGLKEDGSYDVFKAKLGRVAIDEMISKKMRGQDEQPASINPVTEKEVFQTVDLIQTELRNMSEHLQSKLASPKTTVIGTFSPVDGEKCWRKDTARDFLKSRFVNLYDHEGKRSRQTSKAILIYALVGGLQIDKFTINASDGIEGNAAGLLITEEFWK